MKDPCETFFCPYEEEEQARSVNLWGEAFGGGYLGASLLSLKAYLYRA